MAILFGRFGQDISDSEIILLKGYVEALGAVESLERPGLVRGGLA